MGKKETQEEIGSRTAKGGFKNEHLIASKFNNWKNDNEARMWLKTILNIKTLDSLKLVTSKVIGKRSKADLKIEIRMEGNDLKTEYFTLKKQDAQGYNHVGRNTVEYYHQLFDFSNDTITGLKKFCGEEGYSPYDQYKTGIITKSQYLRLRNTPYTQKKKGKISKEGTGRFFFDELSSTEQNSILNDFTEKREVILSEIIKGHEDIIPRWLLVTKKTDDELKFHLEDTDKAVERALNKTKRAKIGPRKGTVILGHIRVQRKGGTGGATQLQFKWKNPFPA